VIGGFVGFAYALLLWIVLSHDFRFIFLFLLPALGTLFGTVVGVLFQSYKDNKALKKR
jgi:hypothetical protein